MVVGENSRILDLEQAIEFIRAEEYLEVTPGLHTPAEEGAEGERALTRQLAEKARAETLTDEEPAELLATPSNAQTGRTRPNLFHEVIQQNV